MSPRSWTPEEVRALGVVTDVTTAGSVLQLGRTTSYELARKQQFPVRVTRMGNQYRVRVADLVHFLALDAIEPAESAAA